MISRERLEELIEQEATIYDPDTMWESIGEIKLNKKMKVKDGRLDGDLGDLGLKGAMCSCFVPLEDLVESKEEAEWIIEFGCITRTEKLELPTWEELFKEDRVLDCYTQEFGIVKNRSFIGVVLLGVDFTNEIVEVSIGSDQIFCELLTKENYILACRKAKELFLGGIDGNIR